MDWDDLRYFLALSREGAIRAAAKRLTVSPSTVLRRIQIFEEKMGLRAFDRTPDGFVLTPEGRKILVAAEAMEEQANALERNVLGRDNKLEGTIQFTLPIDLMRYPILDACFKFTREYPDIDIEFLNSYQLADLSRREADVALRMVRVGQNPSNHLVGRRIAQSHNCVYVSKNGLLDPDNPSLIGWGDATRHPKWVQELPVPKLGVRHGIQNTIGHSEACAAGVGYTVLSCIAGDADPRLERVEGIEPWPSRDFWLLTHPDVRDTLRFRIFREHLFEAIAANRDLIEGRKPNSIANGAEAESEHSQS